LLEPFIVDFDDQGGAHLVRRAAQRAASVVLEFDFEIDQAEFLPGHLLSDCERRESGGGCLSGSLKCGTSTWSDATLAVFMEAKLKDLAASLAGISGLRLHNRAFGAALMAVAVSEFENLISDALLRGAATDAESWNGCASPSHCNTSS